MDDIDALITATSLYIGCMAIHLRLQRIKALKAARASLYAEIKALDAQLYYLENQTN